MDVSQSRATSSSSRRTRTRRSGSFLLPDGFDRPRAARCCARGACVGEAGRYACASLGERRRRRGPRRTPRAPPRAGEPVRAGARLHGRRRHAAADGRHAACAAATAPTAPTSTPTSAARSPRPPSSRRGSSRSRSRRGSRVRIVGHSLGGMLARGLAVRRPDLVSGIVTLGSPMLAPGAHHVLADRERRRAGPAQPGRGARADVGGLRRRRVRAAELRGEPASRCPPGSRFTAIYSRRDGIVDWRACVDPVAHAGRGARLPRRHGHRPAGDRRRHHAAAASRHAGSRASVSARSRSRRKRVASTAGARC